MITHEWKDEDRGCRVRIDSEIAFPEIPEIQDLNSGKEVLNAARREEVLSSEISRLLPMADRAERLLKRVEDLEAEAVALSEGNEIIAELSTALAVACDEGLTPCGDPEACAGHLGEKANAALREALDRWRERKRRAEICAEKMEETQQELFESERLRENQAATIRRLRLRVGSLEKRLAGAQDRLAAQSGRIIKLEAPAGATPGESPKDPLFSGRCCPDCQGTDFLSGPEGGGAQNYKCSGCGSEFNVGPGWSQRIQCGRTEEVLGEGLEKDLSEAAEFWRIETELADRITDRVCVALEELLSAVQEPEEEPRQSGAARISPQEVADHLAGPWIGPSIARAIAEYHRLVHGDEPVPLPGTDKGSSMVQLSRAIKGSSRANGTAAQRSGLRKFLEDNGTLCEVEDHQFPEQAEPSSCAACLATEILEWFACAGDGREV